MIIAKDVAKAYGTNKVLRNVSFAVEKGSIFALLGSNGAGKTTLITILSTLLRADAGTVTIHGFDLRKDAKKIRECISLTGQYVAVDELLTGTENMEMMGRLSHVAPEHIKMQTRTLLRQFELETVANKRLSTYSGGMRRKLDLAISLLASPSIIFLDEPTTGLDPRSRQELWQIIRRLADNGTTIVLTTQYLEEADNLADKIAVLHKGTIVAEGTAEELKQRITSEYAELSFADSAVCARAQGLLPESTVLAAKDARLSLPVTSQIPDLRKILNKLHRAKIEPTGLTIRKPTLDDVFMQLTETSQQESTL